MSSTRTIPASGPLSNPTVSIRIEGAEIGPTVGILSVLVHREFNKIPYARIEVRDGVADERGFPLSSGDLFIPGNEIEILAGYQSNDEVIFKGKITKHRVRASGSGSKLIIEAKDVAVGLTLSRKDRFFRDGTDADAWDAIIGEYSDLELEASGGEVVIPELVQYRMSDWDFLVSRAELNGRFVWVNDGTLNIVAPEAAEDSIVTLAYGSNVYEFDGELDATVLNPIVKASAWNPTSQELDEAEGLDPDFTPNGNLAPDDLSAVFGQHDEEIRLCDPVGAEALQNLADAKVLRQHIALMRGSLSCNGFSTIRPASVVTVEGLGDRMNGDVYVTGIRHEISGGRWVAHIQFGLDEAWFASKVASQAMTNEAARIGTYAGLAIGVVTALADDPESAGRVQVKLPSVDAEGEGLWARMGTLAAGADHGAFFMPEIDDEVVVGFLQNEASHPVILGALYNGTNPPPLSADDDNNEHQFLTKSGLKVYFNDDDKELKLETPDGQFLSLSDGDGAIVMEDSNGNSITLSADGISLKSGKDLIMEASGDVNINGVNITASANAQAKLEGSAGVEVSSSAMATLKGSLVQIN